MFKLLSVVLLLLGDYGYSRPDNQFTFSSSMQTGAQGDIVDTGYAKYLGNRSYPNTVAYLGIPYAEPPIGDRRFRAPIPLNKARVSQESGGSVVDATKYPNACIQGIIEAGSEDCLNINIYAPVGAKTGSNLPVLVYIHGGGYIFGNPASWPFDHWINQSPNVVIVSVYYRLASFGFLAEPALRDPVNGDLNAGFLDQIEALKWVQGNIASFGGDPAKVTINGESAGGSSVELHLVANEGQKLFSGAIAQSIYRSPLPTAEQQVPLFKSFAKEAGCTNELVTAQLSCLRKASVSTLTWAQIIAMLSSETASGYKLFRPVIDGKILTDFPTKLIQAGKFAKVPLMVGATTNETLSGGSDVSASLKSFFPSMSDADVNALVQAYPLADFASSPALQFQTITGDSELRCARSIMGDAFGKYTKSWTYRYNQKTPGESAVGHAAENYIMFRGTRTELNGTTFNALSPAESSFAEELIAYWLSFVRSGDPNTFKLSRSPVWSPFMPQHSRIVLQADPDNTTTISGNFLEKEGAEETKRCDLVASQVLTQRN
ncbi:hypothetical protein GALMADRAFT_223905 [Galerina marginata CBS 339.88]|uniref:Carboxylic ester hydrolase n=1 Tax=Galerina marginata (strain CBS 339.88) TaxID=685588 RepID=A0A067T8F5_GALM3|nr:hypothetical protein GALMADRAFT_223905 [Galerina marginata CBS 339.88]